MSTSTDFTSSRLLLSLAIAPAVLLGLVFGGAIAITQWFAPGTSGSEAMVMAAVLIGVAGGVAVAKLNPSYGVQASVYSASFATLMYISLRLFWFDAPLTLAAAGFVLIIPSALVGAIAANKRKAT